MRDKIKNVEQLQKAYCELEKEFAKKNEKIKELKATNSVLSKELTKNSIIQQDNIETCCGIPIGEIPLLKEQVAIKNKKIAVLEKELNDWKDGTIIVKWGEAEEKCKVLEKALELLAQDYIYFTDEVEITGITEYFIKKAKEELGNE